MTPTTVTPPPQPSAFPTGTPPAGTIQPGGWTPFRWTLPEYRKLGELGMFQDVKVMLIKGEIFTMVMPNPPHDVALGMLDDWLRTVFTSGFHVRNQMGFDVGTDNDPGPDLAVVKGTRRDYLDRTPTTAAMIVEIADTSLSKDTTEKAELYATAGVPEYWVVDVTNRQLHVFRDPVPLPAGLGATAYRIHQILTQSESVSPLAEPSASVRVAELLP